ncbi:MAG: biopolymer transporter ExbD [Aridibacter sp.]
MKPEINVTPLIDVLLVLLIIFMIISPLQPSQFEAKIPSEPDKLDRGLENPDTLIVKINSDSSLELNQTKNLGTIQEPAELQTKLTQVFAKRTENGVLNENLAQKSDLSMSEKIQKTIFIKAPKNLAYGEVVKVIDAVKIVGAKPISLQIDDLE